MDKVIGSGCLKERVSSAQGSHYLCCSKRDKWIALSGLEEERGATAQANQDVTCRCHVSPMYYQLCYGLGLCLVVLR